jgi:hypothetical protein
MFTIIRDWAMDGTLAAAYVRNEKGNGAQQRETNFEFYLGK